MGTNARHILLIIVPCHPGTVFVSYVHFSRERWLQTELGKFRSRRMIVQLLASRLKAARAVLSYEFELETNCRIFRRDQIQTNSCRAT